MDREDRLDTVLVKSPAYAHIEKVCENNVKSGKSGISSVEAEKKFGHTGHTESGNDSEIPDYPHEPCPTCGCKAYWLRPTGKWGLAEWFCCRCHPEPGGAKVTAELTTEVTENEKQC